MGMDIYLECKEMKELRESFQAEFQELCNLRDKAKTKWIKDWLQEKVEEAYAKTFNGETGYYRVNYNDYSISYWIQHNIDHEAKGDWGLEPFYSAVKDLEEPI